MSNRPKRGNSVAQEKDLYAEISEMKQTLDFVSDKLDIITRMQSDLDKAMQAITKLQNDNKLKDERIVTLKNHLDELEQYSRNDNIVLSGLNLQYRSFAGAVSDTFDDHDNSTSAELETLETKVVSYLNSDLGTDICHEDISVCHTLKNKKAKKRHNSSSSKQKNQGRNLQECKEAEGN